MSKVLGVDALAGIRDWVKSEDDAVKAELRTYVGSPLIASTVAGMTDQTKVYVYTGSETGYTAGNWYYYNGSAWTSGGVYNSTALETDPTLTIEGMAADAKATGDEITNLKQDIGELSNSNPSISKWTKTDGEAYSTNGYIDVDSGGLVPHANYTCYVMPIAKDTSVWFGTYPSFCELAVYNGELFRTATLVTCRASSRDNLPLVDSKLNVSEGHSLVVCISTTSSYELFHSISVRSVKTVPITIEPVSSSKFILRVHDSVTGGYLKHEIDHITQTNSISGHSVKTQDVWMAGNILDSSDNIVGFGNLNFIHNLDITGHKGHVGAGHGCCVQVFTQFFADGMLFDPASLSENMECNAFSIIEKVNHYLIDESITTNPDNALPSLNSNNEPIVESVQYLTADYTANNRVHVRNRLDIKYDGSKYIGCYAAMLDVPASVCPNVILNNHQILWTKYTKNGGTYTREIKDGGDVSIGDYGYDGDTVIMFGDSLKYTQRIVSTNGRSDKLNTYMWVAQGGHDWNKAYLMPCVCVRSNQTITSGQSIETFNNGDRLVVDCYRTIDITQ